MIKKQLIVIFLFTVFCLAVKTVNASNMEEVSLSDTFKEESVTEEVTGNILKLKADKLYYDSSAGDIYAQKNVVLVDGAAVIKTHQLYGNSKKNEAWADGRVNFKQDIVNMTGNNFYYNFATKSGSMKQVFGRMNEQLISADDLEFYPQHFVAYNAVTTRCPAETPDIHYSAEKIEIWPNDHMISYGVKYWIKNRLIFSKDKHWSSLKEGDKDDFTWPSIGYDNDAGWWVKYSVEKEVIPNVKAFANLWYSQTYNWRNSFGLLYTRPEYSLNYNIYSFERDGDWNWVKKENDFYLTLFDKRFSKKSPWRWNFTWDYGKWTDEQKYSWHQKYQLNVIRDTIKLSSKDFLDFNMNYSLTLDRMHYFNQPSGIYSNVSNTSFAWTVTENHFWNERFSTLIAYINTSNFNQQTFAYNSAHLAQEGNLGFTYKLNDKTSFTFLWRFDATGQGGTYSYDYSITQDLHCWLLNVWVRNAVGQGAKNIFSWTLTTVRW